MARTRQKPVIWLLVFCLLLLAACASKPDLDVASQTAQSAEKAPGSYQHLAFSPAVIALNTARSMLGVSYRYGGTDPRGFDCSGLVQYSYLKAGVALPRTSQDIYITSKRISREEMRPGDLVFFRISSKKISHVGIYAGNRTFIHSPSSGKGVSYANLDSDYWQHRLVGAGRI